jgi:hypothetical protein
MFDKIEEDLNQCGATRFKCIAVYSHEDMQELMRMHAEVRCRRKEDLFSIRENVKWFREFVPEELSQIKSCWQQFCGRLSQHYGPLIDSLKKKCLSLNGLTEEVLPPTPFCRGLPVSEGVESDDDDEDGVTAPEVGTDAALGRSPATSLRTEVATKKKKAVSQYFKWLDKAEKERRPHWMRNLTPSELLICDESFFVDLQDRYRSDEGLDVRAFAKEVNDQFEVVADVPLVVTAANVEFDEQKWVKFECTFVRVRRQGDQRQPH